MKQQQILAIASILLVQQFYFSAAADLTAADKSIPASTDTTVKPAGQNTTTTSTVSTTAATTPTSTVPPTTPNTPTAPPTTPANTTTTTTTTSPAPTTTTAKPQPPQPRHFDLPSFIGGIVLTIGLIVIGFIAHVIYKSKFDRNYHTL